MDEVKSVDIPTLEAFLLNTMLKATHIMAERNGYNRMETGEQFKAISDFMTSLGITEPTKDQCEAIVKFALALPGSTLKKKEIEEFLEIKGKFFTYVPWATMVIRSDVENKNGHNYVPGEPFILSPMTTEGPQLKYGLKSNLEFGNNLPLSTYQQSMRPATEGEIRKWIEEHFKADRDKRVKCGLHFLYISILFSGLVVYDYAKLGITL